jgi:hypothetical protein
LGELWERICQTKLWVQGALLGGASARLCLVKALKSLDEMQEELRRDSNLNNSEKDSHS